VLKFNTKIAVSFEFYTFVR